jgi:hypothetical protein
MYAAVKAIVINVFGLKIEGKASKRLHLPTVLFPIFYYDLAQKAI